MPLSGAQGRWPRAFPYPVKDGVVLAGFAERTFRRYHVSRFVQATPCPASIAHHRSQCLFALRRERLLVRRSKQATETLDVHSPAGERGVLGSSCDASFHAPLVRLMNQEFDHPRAAKREVNGSFMSLRQNVGCPVVHPTRLAERAAAAIGPLALRQEATSSGLAEFQHASSSGIAMDRGFL